MRTPLGTVAVSLLLALTAAAPGEAARPSGVAPDVRPGAPDAGDYLARGYGNGGYDIGHYAIDVRWHPATGVLSGTTTITARTTQDLSRFDLDFVLPTQSVTVDGVTADFALANRFGLAGRELVVTPPNAIERGSTMRIVVEYRAKPANVQVGYSNWNTTATGVDVWNEPDAAHQWWYPGSSHPRDKATYDVRVSAPRSLTAVTNGSLVSRRVSGDVATTHWRSQPMASYLSFLAIGRYTVVHDHRGGIPAYYAYERGGGTFVTRVRKDVERMPEVIGFLTERFGRYPFASSGAVVSRTPYGTAFESQTRSQFTALYWKYHAHNMWAVVHETAHQWFGDNVTMSSWRHLWLAEGFATYAEWMWSGAHHTGSPQQLFRATYAAYPRGDLFWGTAVTHPDFALSNESYDRGAMFLQALRHTIGASAFFQLLRQWGQVHRHGTASTADFKALAEQVSGRQLDHLVRVWLHSSERPAPTTRNGFPASMTDGHVRVGAAPESFDEIRRTDRMLATSSQPAGGDS